MVEHTELAPPRRRRVRRPMRRDPFTWLLVPILAFSLYQGFSQHRQQEDFGPAFAFTELVDGVPLRWHTCQEIPVLINPGPTGADGFAEISEAVRRIAELTGIRFTVVGESSKIPFLTWSRNGDVTGQWPYPAVLIAWATDDQTDMLQGKESASAVGNPAAFEGLRQIVSGAIALSIEDLDHFAPGFGPGATRGNLILHELGHVVGLAHVDGPRLMNPRVDFASPDGFTNEEIEGLRLLSPNCDKTISQTQQE